MANPLRYSNNATIKYPLSDFHEEGIPNDILLDLSLSIPEGLEPILGVLRVGKGFVFVSLEEKTSREPIASVLVFKPQAAVVVPLTMHVSGFGWVVFGPGLSKVFYSGDVAVDLDPETYVALKGDAPSLTLTVNGIRYVVENTLDIFAANATIKITVEGQTIYLDRNDAEILDEQLKGFTELGDTGTPTGGILQTLDGVRPDANGNVDIDIVNCIEGCDDVYTLTIPRSNEGIGEPQELPLDIFNPPEPLSPLHPCFSFSSSSSASMVPGDLFDGCQEITKINIIEPTFLIAIGTLYTVFPGSSSLSSEVCDNIVWEDLNNMIWEDTNNAIWECSPESPPAETLLLEDGGDIILEDGEPWLLE
jgi:hypothetical protein